MKRLVVMLLALVLISGCVEYNTNEELYVDRATQGFEKGAWILSIESVYDWDDEPELPEEVNITILYMTLNVSPPNATLTVNQLNHSYQLNFNITNIGDFVQQNVTGRTILGECINHYPDTKGLSYELLKAKKQILWLKSVDDYLFGDPYEERLCMFSVGLQTSPSYYYFLTNTTNQTVNLTLNLTNSKFNEIEFLFEYPLHNEISYSFKINSTKSDYNKSDLSCQRIYYNKDDCYLDTLENGIFNLSLKVAQNNTFVIIKVNRFIDPVQQKNLTLGDIQANETKNFSINVTIPADYFGNSFLMGYLLLHSNNGGYLRVPLSLETSGVPMFEADNEAYIYALMPGESVHESLLLYGLSNSSIDSINISCTGDSCQFLNFTEKNTNLSLQSHDIKKLGFDISVDNSTSPGVYSGYFIFNSSNAKPKDMKRPFIVFVRRYLPVNIYFSPRNISWWEIYTTSIFNLGEQPFIFVTVKNTSGQVDTNFNSITKPFINLTLPNGTIVRINTTLFSDNETFFASVPNLTAVGSYKVLVYGTDTKGKSFHGESEFNATDKLKVTIYDYNYYLKPNVNVNLELDVDYARGYYSIYEPINYSIRLTRGNKSYQFDSEYISPENLTEGKYLLEVNASYNNNIGSTTENITLYNPINISYYLSNQKPRLKEKFNLTIQIKKPGNLTRHNMSIELFPSVFCDLTNYSQTEFTRDINATPFNITVELSVVAPPRYLDYCRVYVDIFNKTDSFDYWQGTYMFYLNLSQYELQDSYYLSDNYIEIGEIFYLQAYIENHGASQLDNLTAKIVLPDGLELVDDSEIKKLNISDNGYVKWRLMATKPYVKNVSFVYVNSNYTKNNTAQLSVYNSSIGIDILLSKSSPYIGKYVTLSVNATNNLSRSIYEAFVNLSYDTSRLELINASNISIIFLKPGDKLNASWNFKAKAKGVADINLSIWSDNFKHYIPLQLNVKKSSPKHHSSSGAYITNWYVKPKPKVYNATIRNEWFNATMRIGDKILFTYKQQFHEITVIGITNDKIIVLIASEPKRFEIPFNVITKLDIDGDGQSDLEALAYHTNIGEAKLLLKEAALSTPKVTGMASCNDRIKNQGELGIDCGGPCKPCEQVQQPSCSDGIKNQGELGIDCGGPCKPCSHQPQNKEEPKPKRKSTVIVMLLVIAGVVGIISGYVFINRSTKPSEPRQQPAQDWTAAKQQLKDYIKKTLTAGYSPAQIRGVLLNNGWQEELVEEMMSETAEDLREETLDVIIKLIKEMDISEPKQVYESLVSKGYPKELVKDAIIIAFNELSAS